MSLSIWCDEKALIRWRMHSLQHLIPGKGQVVGTRLWVGEIVADTDPERPLRQQHFYPTEVSLAKAMPVTEHEAAANIGGSSRRSKEIDAFDSITRPSHMHLLQSWHEVSLAEAAAAEMPGHNHVIRAYGMHDRAEARQCFPPVQP